MADNEPVWERITKNYPLRSIPYKEVAFRGFCDAIFGTEYDDITSTIKVSPNGLTIRE
jgi:hypothetical protein